MNYQRIYDQIIDRANKESRKKSNGIYYEKHHILPRCLGGSNQKENLILLTGREHLIAHRLLTRIHPGNSKLAFAFWGMCNLKDKNQKGRHTPSSRTYAEAKELHSVSKKAFYQTKEGKYTRAKQVTNTDYVARAANTDLITKAANTDYVTKVANTDYKLIAEKNKKPIFQLSKEETFIKEWSSGKEAGETLKIQGSDISACCRGRLKSAGGFIWKYVK